MTGDCYVLKSIQRILDVKYLKCFQTENFVFKFFLRIVGPHCEQELRWGVFPNLSYAGTCRPQGIFFWPRCSKQGIQFDLPPS